MNKQSRTVMIALLMAIVVMLIYWRAGRTTTPLPTVALPTGLNEPSSQGQVIIAKADIPAGSETLDRRHVREWQFPENLISVGTAQNVSDVIGKDVIEDIFADEIIFLKRVRDKSVPVQTLAQSLKENQRAITLDLDGIAANAGFIQAGDLIDVIAIFPPSSQAGELVKIVLQKIEILAVGGQFTNSLRKDPDKMIRGGPGVNRLTLAVTPQQASVLNHLKSRTRFYFILRNPKSADEVETDGWSAAKLTAEAIPPHLMSVVQPEKKQYNVPVFFSTQRTDQKVTVDPDEAN